MTKEEKYLAILPRLRALLAGETDEVARMSNMAAVLHSVSSDPGGPGFIVWHHRRNWYSARSKGRWPACASPRAGECAAHHGTKNEQSSSLTSNYFRATSPAQAKAEARSLCHAGNVAG